MPSEAYAVVMAGGSGTRLWPLSTPERPKQFLVFNEKSLIQRTVDRLLPLFPPERIYIVALAGQEGLIHEHLPQIPRENIILEPLGRNTAPCIGLAALALKRVNPDAVMVALPADHHIAKGERFRQALALGIEVARDGYLVTLGIIPDHPATGYGYIEIAPRQEIRGAPDGLAAYPAARFVEKPSLERAKHFLESGRYYWNSGIFIWRVERILEEIAHHLPELSQGLKEIEAHWGTPELNTVISKIYNKLAAVSIDYGVLEHATKIAVIPVELGWSDLGDWDSVGAILPKDQAGNAIRATHIGIDLQDSIIFSAQNRLIATIGLQNIVIVDTPGALLIMDRARAQEVKELLARLRSAKEGKEPDHRAFKTPPRAIDH